jgi:hypothetical protein
VAAFVRYLANSDGVALKVTPFLFARAARASLQSVDS